MEDAVEGARHVLDEEEVPRVLARPVQRHGAAARELVREFGDQLLGELVRAVDVVAARDDHGQPEGPVVGLHEELGRGLRRRVRVRGLEDVVLDHGRRLHGLALAVDLVRRDVDEAHDVVHLRGLEQHVRAEDVVPRELERVAERVVDVRLRREVHDRVDLLRLQDVVDEVRRADVALDEFVVRQRRDLLEVREARAVVEAVEVQDLVLRVPARRRRLAQLI